MSAPRRLYREELPTDGGRLRLPDAAARHARVLRLTPGDRIVLFDGRGREADAVLLEAGWAEAGAPREVPSTGSRVVLCQALPKGAKLDSIVRATTELGVLAIHLVEAARSVTRLDPARAAKRLDRLDRIAREAARQCGRADVPHVTPPAPLAAVLARAPEAAARLVALPDAPPEASRAAARATEGWVLVGPEGGLTPEEVQRTRQAGFTPVSLGPHTLRVETAAAVACALVRERLSPGK